LGHINPEVIACRKNLSKTAARINMPKWLKMPRRRKRTPHRHQNSNRTTQKKKGSAQTQTDNDMADFRQQHMVNTCAVAISVRLKNRYKTHTKNEPKHCQHDVSFSLYFFRFSWKTYLCQYFIRFAAQHFVPGTKKALAYKM